MKTFSKGYSNNWSYKVYKDTEIFNDTIPTYHIDKVPERYNEAFVKPTQLTMTENDSVMKKLKITQIKPNCLWLSELMLTILIVETEANFYIPAGMNVF